MSDSMWDLEQYWPFRKCYGCSNRRYTRRCVCCSHWWCEDCIPGDPLAVVPASEDVEVHLRRNVTPLAWRDQQLQSQVELDRGENPFDNSLLAGAHP